MIAYLCLEHGSCKTKFSRWRSKFSGKYALKITEMNTIQDENRLLKKMFAELSMQNDLLKEALERKIGRPS